MQRWLKHVSVPTNLGRCYHPALAVLGDEGGLMGVIARTTRQVTARTGAEEEEEHLTLSYVQRCYGAR